MVKLLIVEANTPERVSRGQAAAEPFLRTFQALGRGVDPRVINPFEVSIGAADLDGCHGVIFTGSGEKWCVDASEVKPHRDAMEYVLGAGLPVWGSCNGMQLAALVLGSESAASPHGLEVGVARDIKLSVSGCGHPMMAGRSDGFSVPCIHRDSVKRVPAGATLLASNWHTPVQAFAWSDGQTEVWATQYHPELGLGDVAGYIRVRGIFENETQFLRDLESAEHDEAAAQRLGSCPADLTLTQRARELINWLDFVQARADNRSAA